MPFASSVRSASSSLLCALVLLGLAAPPSWADDADDPDDAASTPAPVANATVLAADSYPGVQLISTTYQARVSVAVPVIDQGALEALGTRIGQQAVSGAIDVTDEALTEAVVDAIVKSPNTYFVAGPRTYSRRQSLTGVGTGWVITPNGYIVTAAHVVATPEPQLRVEFANQSLTKLGRTFVNGLSRSGASFTPDQVDRLTRVVLDWFAARMRVDDLSVSVSANLALGFDGLGKNQKAVAAEVVDVGKPYPGNDVALLKIDGQEHLPTISLGTNTDVSPGSTVHVVGYPAASTFSAGFSQDSQAQPTVTEGPVTAVKSTGSGMPVFQTQAPASPGNSGGPVITDEGESVGVLVANAVDSDGSTAAGQAFVIPASEVEDMLKQNGVEAEQSDTSAAYHDAVVAFYSQQYKGALPLFEKVETLYPAHPFAAKFIADSKAAIEAGEDRTPVAAEESGSGKLWLWIVVGVVGIAVLVAAFAGVFYLGRRGTGRASGHPVDPYAPVSPPGPGGDYAQPTSATPQHPQSGQPMQPEHWAPHSQPVSPDAPPPPPTRH